VLNEMHLRVMAAGHDLAGGEAPQRLASGFLMVALRDPLGLLARGLRKKGATAHAAWSAPARALCAARGSVCAR
jgi:hypothetical protein